MITKKHTLGALDAEIDLLGVTNIVATKKGAQWTVRVEAAGAAFEQTTYELVGSLNRALMQAAIARETKAA